MESSGTSQNNQNSTTSNDQLTTTQVASSDSIQTPLTQSQQEACIKASQEYIDLYNSYTNTPCDANTFWKLENRKEYCGKCWPSMNQVLFNANNACGSYIDAQINANYLSMDFMKTYFCSQDNDGTYCDQIVVGYNYYTTYSKWPKEQINNDCTIAMDEAIRRNLNNTNILVNYGINPELFVNDGNKLVSTGSPATSQSSQSSSSNPTLIFDAESKASTNFNISFFTLLFIFIVYIFRV